jgi:hypothetical protein
MTIATKCIDNPPSPGIPGNPAGKFPGAEPSPLISIGLLDCSRDNVLGDYKMRFKAPQY